ncbi:Mediator of RNA polymerase II transcription subunit 16 [Emydomyces testavorans]|uniref:Mediator of RNA polymerase II transcription subunit 16 n=1 Tax=Emydomyces testavorans TaxID=2070801 RepID=A0AAF0DMN0_9EURO|nr:Mediator of RNA polymerase II transcription subunit 16 [Emydomyces testavorans]
MDTSIDVDDLFGDTNSLELGLATPAPILKGLSQRLDELHLSGCCRKVAWSKLGGIAYISHDGQKVLLRNIFCKSDDGTWSLRDEKTCSQIAESQNGHIFVHLCWHETGSDLAIVDSCGRILTVSVSIALNVFAVSRPTVIDSDDDGNQPVGLMWLRVNRPNQDPRWNEIHVEMQTVARSDDVLTHAALAPSQAITLINYDKTGGTILIATYSAQGRLCVYRLQIKWETTATDTAQQRPPGSKVSHIPAVQVNHIKTEVLKDVFQKAGDNVDGCDPSTSALNSVFSLTHLEIFSTSSNSSGGGAVEHYISAAFSAPMQQQLNGPSSVLVRWALEAAGQSLHGCFDEILPGRPIQPLTLKTELLRQDDIYFDRFVLSIDYTEAGNVVALTFDGGNTSFFDAKTMISLSDADDLTIVSSMPQAGFNFPNDGLEKFSAAVAALTLAFARACGNDNSSDDILMIAMRHLTADTQKTFISEVYRALSLNADFTIEQDKLMNNPYIQKCFSMQAALGFCGRFQPRNLAAAVPWCTLQLRQISILFAYFLHFNKTGGDSECHEPDILRMIFGNVKWALDLAKYLIDDLFEIASNFDAQSGDQSNKNFEFFSVLLILSSIPRSFLKYICRGLRGIPSSFRNAPNLSNECFEIYARTVTLIEESPLRVDVYEKFLLSIDNVIKYTYQSAGFGNSDRAAPERDLLVTGSVPPVLQPAVVTILNNTMSLIRPDVDLLRLCTWDYSWLGIGDDMLTKRFARQNEVDILRKTIVRINEPHRKSTQPARRCVRCCAFSEDVTSPRSLALFRLLVKTVVLRTCLCGAMWTMENVDGMNNAPLIPGWKV